MQTLNLNNTLKELYESFKKYLWTHIEVLPFHFHILLALIGSLTIGTTFFLSFLVGILSDKIGLRLTSVIGAVLATLGMGLSALLYRYLHNIYTHICNKYLHTHLQ